MSRPPVDPRNRPTFDQPSWRSVLASYALMVAFLLLLWSISSPLSGVVTIAAIVGFATGARRVAKLVRCFHECGGFALDLGGKVRIAVTQPRIRDPDGYCGHEPSGRNAV